MNARKILAALVIAGGASTAFAAETAVLEGPNAVPNLSTQTSGSSVGKTRAEVNAELRQSGGLQSLNGPYLFKDSETAAPKRAKAAQPVNSSEAPVIQSLG